MKKLIINGGRPLFGKVQVSGSKNGALPILFASVVTSGITEVIGCPRIGDTAVALELLGSLGVGAEWQGQSLFLDTRELKYTPPNAELVRKIRASTYLIGATLARFGEAELCSCGGCNFADRPIDLHIYAAECLGARIDSNILKAGKLNGGEISLPLPSVGATVNSLIMAAAAEGETHIKGYAKEPHVLLLIDYLRSAGAEIELAENLLTVRGRALGGGRVKIIGDMIEAGTYIAAGLLTGGEVEVSGIDNESMKPFSASLCALGARVRSEEDSLSASIFGRGNFLNLRAEPYPGFPTDLQPITAPLLARFSGGRIEDSVFPERLGYLCELSRFGISSQRDRSGALILPSSFMPASVKAPCLRGGAACLLAALCAEGESIIDGAEIIERGYENIEEKLRALGALISTEQA